MILFKAPSLTSAAIDVLEQLFVKGPTWDGNIVSKSGRDELIAMDFAFRDNGWASLTSEGIRLAVSWDRAALARRYHQGWLDKLRRS